MVLTFTATGCVEHTTTKYLDNNEDIRKAFNLSVIKTIIHKIKSFRSAYISLKIQYRQ